MDTKHSLYAFTTTSVSVPPMTTFPPMTPNASNGTPSNHLPHHQLSHQQQQDSIDRARAYKSRNKRPCDFCRYKKAACHLDSQPPCELCVRYNKECTFVESPAKRRRPNDGSGDGQQHSKQTAGFDPNHPSNNAHFANGAVEQDSLDFGHDLLPWDGGMPQFPMSSIALNSGNMEFGPFDPALYRDQPIGFDTFGPMSTSSGGNGGYLDGHMPGAYHQHRNSIETTPSQTSATLPMNLQLPFELTSGEPSLDQQASSNALIVGMSGESDPYLLSRYRYDNCNEASFQSVRVRKMNDPGDDEGDLPIFFTIQHNALSARAQPPERMDVLDRYRREVEDMISDNVGQRLIRLFYRYVQPYFPVLSRESVFVDDDGNYDLHRIPTYILAAIYGHALAFCAWDEKLCVDVYTPPSADVLFNIAYLSALPAMHTPSLSLLTTFLLLLQRRPTNKHVSDTPFKWVLMGMAISVAQTLGINRDPSDWPLPEWEIKLRRRLAWATFTQDRWLALNFGRSSHINAEDWDVDDLAEDDFEDGDRIKIGDTATCEHFIRLCNLTVIVHDIMHGLFSLRATRRLANNLEATLEAAKPLRIRLTEWYQVLPPSLRPQQTAPVSPESFRPRSSQHDLDGNGSLHLAYITAKIELFRAMLRPKATDVNLQALQALRTGAIGVAKEVFDFLQALNAKELEAFWGSYARTNFVIASSFMLLLFVSAPNITDATECLSLLHAWRSLLRIKSRSCDLLNLALLRLDGVYVVGMERLIDLSPAAAQAWAESEQGQ